MKSQAAKSFISQVFIFTIFINLLILSFAKSYDKEFTSSAIDFAFNIYRKVESNENENIFISPASLFIDLALVLPGAKGNTAVEMKNAMAIQNIKNNKDIYENVRELMSEINKENSNFTLNTANRIYIEKSLTLLPEYLKIFQTYFNGSLEKVDFTKNIQSTLNIINNWVKVQTHDKIPSIFTELDPDTKLVSINALYFKAKWQTTFKSPDTKSKPFTTAAGNIVQTNLMEITNPTKRFNYTNNDILGCEILELPYADHVMSMYILLPQEGNNINTVESGVNAKTLTDAINNMRETSMRIISIPKIHLEKTYEMNKALQDLGMKDVFTNAADLSAMNGGHDLKVDRVVQKTYLEVNEERSEAAAATIFEIQFMSEDWPVSFVADRPFIFFIRNNINKQLLFLGRYVTPQ